MPANTFTTKQLLTHDCLHDLESICRDIISVLGTGTCKLNTCDACHTKHDEAVQLAQEAIEGLRVLSSQLEELIVIPSRG